MNSRSYLIRKAIEIFSSNLLILLSIFLVSCGQAEHPPQDGEYGKKLLISKKIDQETIDLLNSDTLPKPFFEQVKKELLTLGFEADSSKNPYRFVVVAHGYAEKRGEVDVSFIGGVKSIEKKEMAPTIILEEDTTEYQMKEKVLLVLPSDPFSIDIYATSKQYLIQVGLSTQDNFVFEELEIQIWQGKGDTYPTIYYLWFFCIVAIPLLVVYRFVSGFRV